MTSRRDICPWVLESDVDMVTALSWFAQGWFTLLTMRKIEGWTHPSKDIESLLYLLLFSSQPVILRMSHGSSSILQTFIKRHAPPIARIIEPLQILLAQLRNRGVILLFQLAIRRPKIFLDPVRMLALWYDAVTPAHTPSQSHLCICTSALFRNLRDVFAHQQ